MIGLTFVLVVIDANVFVSAAIQRGASHRIIESWLSGAADFEVVMSPELLREIREVLTTRPRLRKWISLETATLFVDTIETLVDLVDDPDEVQTETRDPNDDYLIALARSHVTPLAEIPQGCSSKFLTLVGSDSRCFLLR